MHSRKKALLARYNKLKYYVRRFGIIKTARKVILPTITIAALNVSNLSAQPQSNTKSDKTQTLTENVDKNLLAYNRKVVLDISSEIDGRAEWFVNNFLLAAQSHLDAIQKTRNKKAYIKQQFFDIVSPSRNLSGSTPYCITALNRALIDANKLGGDLDNVLPNPNTSECYAANECNAFAKFLRKKGFGDCIDEGRIKYNNLQPGDIVLTVRNRNGDRHAQQYIGKKNNTHYCLSFNSDGIRELKSTNAIVIHMHKLTRKAIIKNMKKKKLITNDSELGNIVVSLEQARRIQDFLQQGREQFYRTFEPMMADKDIKTPGNTPFDIAFSTSPTTQNILTAYRRRSSSRG